MVATEHSVFNNEEHCKAVVDPRLSLSTLKTALRYYPNLVSLATQHDPKSWRAACESWKTHTGQNKCRIDGAKSFQNIQELINECQEFINECQETQLAFARHTTQRVNGTKG